jgi:hypothetical protein
MVAFGMSINPYAPPKATDDVEVAAVGSQAPALWNPGAAANWSLLFTPAFGAYLHMLNWRALGEVKKAATAKGWFYASVAFIVAVSSVAALLPDSPMLGRYVGLGFLVAWYYGAAREQTTYVKERFGTQYPRKGWGKPLSIGVLLIVVLVFVAGAIGVAVGLTQRD